MTPSLKLRFLSDRRTRLLIIWLVGLVLVIGYVVLMSAWQAGTNRWIRFSDLLIPRAIDVVVGGWFFFVGSSIGSFLNVVVWRMPRGVSVNGRSHCPWCDQTLSWKDNWPVFGWLALAGRCRTCRMPISPRYPIVELVVGLTIFFVGMVELYAGGASLPFHPERWGRTGPLWSPNVTAENLLTMTYHIVAVAVAWAMGLVRFDGHRLPRLLVGVSLALVIVPMLAIPGVAVVPWQPSMNSAWRADGDYVNAAMRIFAGLGVAVAISAALSHFLAIDDHQLNPPDNRTVKSVDLVAMLVIPAVVVGWQATFAVTIVAVVIAYCLPLVLPRDRAAFSRFGIALPIALTLQLCLWRWLHSLTWYPSVNTSPLVTIAWAAAVVVVPYCLVWQSRTKRQVHDVDRPISDDGWSSPHDEAQYKQHEKHKEQDLRDARSTGHDTPEP